jgi:hypothetical protein
MRLVLASHTTLRIADLPTAGPLYPSVLGVDLLLSCKMKRKISLETWEHR